MASLNRMAAGSALLVALAVGAAPLRAQQPVPPPDAPEAWKALLGEYGPDSAARIVLEDRGQLVLRWDSVGIPLHAVRGDSFRLEGGGAAVFRRDSGRIAALFIGDTILPRRALGPRDGNQLRVAPNRPVPELIAEARRMTPPPQPDSLLAPDLVDLAALDPTIRFDIRYATTNNFLGSVFYSAPRAFMQRPAAEALVRVHRGLRALGYGLLIHDAYRPWYVTRVFWDATPEALRWMVANPANGSRHNRGSAVDLTLFDLATGQPVEMPGTYDETTHRSYADYPGGTSRQRWHRAVLLAAMEAGGFVGIADEWWHFDWQEWRRYPVLNLTFEEL